MAVSLYPTIEQVFNLTRVYLNDTFSSGAGRIFIDSWTPNLTILNTAIQTLQRDLENSGVPRMRAEIIYTGLPPVTSSLGVGVPNPAVWQRLGFDGFDPGNGVVNTSFQLPQDLVVPYCIQQRNTGTDLTFSDVMAAPGWLDSRYQDYTIGAWEWRGDSIWWNGALVEKDIRLRYDQTAATVLGTLPANFATTYIQILDSLEPLAYRTAWIFSASRVGETAATGLLQMYELTKNALMQRALRSLQFATWERPAFGENGDLFGWYG